MQKLLYNSAPAQQVVKHVSMLVHFGLVHQQRSDNLACCWALEYASGTCSSHLYSVLNRQGWVSKCRSLPKVIVTAAMSMACIFTNCWAISLQHDTVRHTENHSHHCNYAMLFISQRQEAKNENSGWHMSLVLQWYLWRGLQHSG